MSQILKMCLGIDEFHQSLTGHWDSFRPEMMKVTSRLRIYRAPGSPCIAMSATATPAEIASTITNLGFRTNPIVLTASPVQANLKFVTLKRSPNIYGADGFEDKNGVWHPGYLALLRRLYLDEFISGIRDGTAVKRGIIFCRY